MSYFTLFKFSASRSISDLLYLILQLSFLSSVIVFPFPHPCSHILSPPNPLRKIPHGEYFTYRPRSHKCLHPKTNPFKFEGHECPRLLHPSKQKIFFGLISAIFSSVSIICERHIYAKIIEKNYLFTKNCYCL